LAQVPGLIAWRMLCNVKAGAASQRRGLIRFGSRVNVYLPPDVGVKVSIGDKVWAAKTILAMLS
jgi:phosphatidylserine decarboxylase